MKSVPLGSQYTVEFTAFLPFAQHSLTYVAVSDPFVVKANTDLSKAAYCVFITSVNYCCICYHQFGSPLD